MLFVEFILNRSCNSGEGAGLENEFWIAGTINLVSSSGKKLTTIQNLDTIKFVECVCTYKDLYLKSNFEIIVANSYKKALEIAKKMDGFQIAITKSIAFNDTLNTKIDVQSTDTSYSHLVKYKNLFTIDLALEEVGSCYPEKAVEIRTYQTQNFIITILRLRCNYIENSAIEYNKKRFQSIETAFWKEHAQ